jgi:hypothetical protein
MSGDHPEWEHGVPDNKRDLRRIVSLRGITKLYHFTPLVNVSSILKNGLASREVLQDHSVEFLAPDRQRLDNCLNALSLSIHSVNKSLLMKKMREYGGDWPILEIDASVLWTHNCRFCWTNAASSEITNHRGFLGGRWGFEKMFEDRGISGSDLRSQRETYGRLANQPTDFQAEVQVLDPIDSNLIVDFTVKSPRVKLALEATMKSVGEYRPIVVNEKAFQ